MVGKFVDHRVENEIHDKIGENLPPGSAGIIAVFDDEQRLAVEQALGGSLLKSVVQSDKSGRRGVEGLAGGGDGEVRARPHGAADPGSELRRDDGANVGSVGGRLDDHPGAEGARGAPNVLICLIDDAGFGAPDTFGGAISTPNLTRVQKQGLTYNAFHVTAVCSPTRAALLTGRNHHRVGMGTIAEFPGPYPGYTGTRPRSCTPCPESCARTATSRAALASGT